jgi:hypothetical protein
MSNKIEEAVYCLLFWWAWSTMNSSWCLWSIPSEEGLHSGQYSLRSDFRSTYFCLPLFKSFFFQVVFLIAFETQLTAALHAGSLVSCHNFRSLCLCLNNRSKPGRSCLRSRSVILLVDSLYAEAIEAEKLRAALSASTHNLIWLLGDINWEGRFWNGSQSIFL